MDKQKEIIYSRKNLEEIKRKSKTWWMIHSDEHPSGKRYIGYV